MSIYEDLKGSGRSFGDFNLAEALLECQDVIVGGGGHAGACGVKVQIDQFESFLTKINDHYRSLKLPNQEKYLEQKEDIATSELGDFSLDLLADLSELEPYGMANQEPVWLLQEVLVLSAQKMGTEDQHLRLLVRGKDKKTIKLVAFYAPKQCLCMILLIGVAM